MPVLQLEINENEYKQLGEFARAANQSAENFAAEHLRQWLAGHSDRVKNVWRTVLAENAELYRRLA